VEFDPTDGGVATNRDITTRPLTDTTVATKISESTIKIARRAGTAHS
jgi:hypothetical protein